MRLFFEGSQKHKDLAINGMPPTAETTLLTRLACKGPFKKSATEFPSRSSAWCQKSEAELRAKLQDARIVC